MCEPEKANENLSKESDKHHIVIAEIENHKDMKGGLIPVLHTIQDLYGYLPEKELECVSDGLNIPMTEIYGVASFYSFFSLEPKGKHVIRVCLGTACYVRGSQKIIDEVAEELKIKLGETTSDGLFTFEATRCLGACGLAPVLMIDGKVYGGLSPDKIHGILSKYI